MLSAREGKRQRQTRDYAPDVQSEPVHLLKHRLLNLHRKITERAGSDVDARVLCIPRLLVSPNKVQTGAEGGRLRPLRVIITHGAAEREVEHTCQRGSCCRLWRTAFFFFYRQGKYLTRPRRRVTLRLKDTLARTQRADPSGRDIMWTPYPASIVWPQSTFAVSQHRVTLRWSVSGLSPRRDIENRWPKFCPVYIQPANYSPTENL